MAIHGRDDERRARRLQLREPSDARPLDEEERDDLVFDFTGLERPDLLDLSFVLTARLVAPEERVWVRALPARSWGVLQALGLDHLFHPWPGPSEGLN
jgi:hypothetical protein